MGYYIRVLSPSAKRPPFAAIRKAIKDKKLSAKLKVESGRPDKWEQLLLSHETGEEIALIEANHVARGSLGEDEVSEFLECAKEGRPASAAKWLGKYLPRVKMVYALQLLEGKNRKNGWAAIDVVQSFLHSHGGGICQADYEGFSNEDGFHILWEYDEGVKGKRWMGLLLDGEWVHFQMDLGNKNHRAAFLKGKLPAGVKLKK
jgi:hypothetical protein